MAAFFYRRARKVEAIHGVKSSRTSHSRCAARVRVETVIRHASVDGDGEQILFCRADIAQFDPAFRLFWQARTLPSIEAPPMLNPALQSKMLRAPKSAFREIPFDTNSEEIKNARQTERVMVELQQTYSQIEVLRKKKSEAFTWEEIEQAKELTTKMTWRVGKQPTRRLKRVKQGDYSDMRQLVRRNLKHGGEFIDLVWKDTKYKTRPLVVLYDISGSMERYSRILLHFVHTLSIGLEHVETFLFGTRLTRITRELERQDIDEAIRQVAKHVQGWGGGTRIGEALKTFNYQWARRVAARGAVVLIISDGWNRGDIDLLRHEIERMQKSCFRLIWLNPLLGLPGYEPLTQGLQAVLPSVDDFLPVHNLESLESLARELAKLDTARPTRRQCANQRP